MGILSWLQRKRPVAEESGDVVVDWSQDYGSDASAEPVDPEGFGHRAHRPDPEARYGFDIDPDYRARKTGAT